MRIGIFSDSHSNNYALINLFKKEKNIDKWLSMGDNVGLFPNVNETIDIIRKHNVISVKGDHEYYLLNKRKMKYSFSGNQSINAQKELLTEINYKYIKSLKMSNVLEIDDIKILITHFFNSEKEDYSDVDKYKINWQIIENVYKDYNVVCYGHTHIPNIYFGKTTIFINPGSIGFPIVSQTGASYCVFDTEDKTILVSNVDFDKRKLICDIKNTGYNKKYITYLKNKFQWQST
jgi:putative phosphoesterase